MSSGIREVELHRLSKSSSVKKRCGALKEGDIWAPQGGTYVALQNVHMVPPTVELPGWAADVRRR